MFICGGAVIAAAIGPQQMEAFAADNNYTRNATATPEQLEASPGVYYVKAITGDDKATATLGILSVGKDTLAAGPTTESPAIIMGAAVNYERRTGPTGFEPLPGMEGKGRVAPYSYFRYGIVEEEAKDANGNITKHQKLSGIDDSFYIIRIDLTDLLDGVTDMENKYLHVSQKDNKALMVAVGFDGTTYSNGGNKTGSYALKDNYAALKDSGPDDLDKETPYFDVILDVNSFDIQIANNNEKDTAALTIKRGAKLTIMDGSKTAGAELAIGNNATMVIEKDGVLEVDESCTGEVEYDAARDKAETDRDKARTAAGTLHVVKGQKVRILTNATASKAGRVAFLKAKNKKKVSVPKTVKINGKTFRVVQINPLAFKGKKIRTVIVGANVKTIKKGAFSKSRTKTIILKTKKLTKRSVKGSLKGSKVKKIKVKVGKRSLNKKYAKKYRKIFKKKNSGKKVKVK